MLKLIAKSMAILTLASSIPAHAVNLAASAAAVSLFDGKSLDGWQSNEGIWRIEDGAITAGSYDKKFPRNEFICTAKSYANFELKLKIKCSGDPKTGLINSGIQIRSARLPNGGVVGYQIDCGDGWFGKIYDEHRRALIYPKPIDEKKLKEAIDTFGWNEYRILAEGPRIQVWINGVKASDYTETHPLVPLEGIIAPQIHSGGKVMVQFKDVTIRELPPTKGAPTWKSLGTIQEAIKKAKVPAPKPEAENGNNKTAAEQLEMFKVPEGYELELVLQESEGVGKFISVYFDQRGRLWTQTALEYPVDANENPAVAEALYKSHAKDKVLVYPRESLTEIPEGGLTDPTVFADGLAIPLGILPWGNGDSAYVLHGPDLLLLTDTDGDGKADQREVILTGLGTQDSHLFPHQFTRAPGDWIWMAQGLFNNSDVKQPDKEDSVKWPKCSMARMRPDGSGFEVTSVGPNNIWGLSMTGEGETFIQEANDYGYALMPFHEFAYYPGGMKAFKKSYQPPFPVMTSHRMGGSGLSGLCLLENGPAVDAESEFTMLLANPITRKIQTMGMQRKGAGWDLKPLPDFLTCGDPNFRPVAMTQGPDGCLYIVDWYNKIISHNEVPRNHPERDKTRGRIWRLKPVDAAETPAIPDFTKLKNSELVAMLGELPTARAHLAWQTLTDREDPGAEVLKGMVQSANHSDAARIQAFWTLGDDGVEVATALLSSENRNVRRQLASYPKFALKLTSDPDPEVRYAAQTTLGRSLPSNAEPSISAMIHAAGATLTNPATSESYESKFERFLVRFFLERHPEVVGKFLDSSAAKELSIEGRMLAASAMPADQGAARVIAMLPQLKRAPNEEELLLLSKHPDTPGSAEALTALLANPALRAKIAKQLIEKATRIDSKKMAPLLLEPARALLQAGDDGAVTALQLASAFSLSGLEPDIIKLLQARGGKVDHRVAALQALRTLRSTNTKLLAKLATDDSEDARVRSEALNALAAAPDRKGAERLLKLFPQLSVAQQRIALTGLASTKEAAQALVAAITAKQIPESAIDTSLGERLATLLAGDAALDALMSRLDLVFGEVLRLNGKPGAFAKSAIDLEGPFTVETWIRLDPKISSEDGILAANGVADFNFHDALFRVWTKNARDIVTASKPISAELWTHIAVTRDAEGTFRLYLDGEPDSVSKKKSTEAFPKLNIGYTSRPSGGTAGAMSEFRVWNRARSASEIRQNFDRSLIGSSETSDLVFPRSQGSDPWGPLVGGAALARTTDLPPLMTLEEAKALDAKFEKYMKLGQSGGDPKQGKLLSALCTSCHVIDGQGGQLGPNLSGAAEMGLEGVLRNILTPNAAMESGYRIYRVEKKNGEIIDAFFVSEDKKAVVIRLAGLADQRIPKSEIASTRFIRRSLMPEGLLDGLSDQQVADLLAYLMGGQKK